MGLKKSFVSSPRPNLLDEFEVVPGVLAVLRQRPRRRTEENKKCHESGESCAHLGPQWF